MGIVRIDDLLPKIADIVLEAYDEAWSLAILEFKVDDGMRTHTLHFERPGEELEYPELSTEQSVAIDTLFKEVWKRYAAVGEPWTKAMFTLTREGKAKLHFDYTPLEE